MEHGERFNTWTHAAGTLLAIAGSAVLIVMGALSADARKIVSFSIYGATLILLYLASTLYHNARQGRAKYILGKLDHNAIYLLIAGTYTPFLLVTLKGAWGWSLFGVVWGLALVGIVQEIWLSRRTRIVSMILYVLMGWVVLVAIVPLAHRLSWAGFGWLLAGGLTYTVGIVFYLNDEKFRHWHGIWHLFVLAGSMLHYWTIFLYVA